MTHLSLCAADFESLCAEDDVAVEPVDPAAGCVKGAYDAVIRPFHSWLLRKTFDIVSTQSPTMPEVIEMVGPGLGDAEREGKVFDEMEFYLSVGRPVVELLEDLMAELQLEDLRQV